MENGFTWKIGGEAGYGIMSSGLIFAKACLRSGYFVVDSNEYPSLIRGGHNGYTVRASKEKIFSIVKSVDVLVALDKNTVVLHQKELSKDAYIILNTDKVSEEEAKTLTKSKIYPIPLMSLAKEAGGEPIMANTIALGATFYIVDGDFDILAECIRETFSKGKKDIADINVRMAKTGFDFAKNNFAKLQGYSLKKQEPKDKFLFLSGSDGICLGAVKAGCKFFAAYPMTPINSIINYFAKNGPEIGVVYKQPEDEISAINMTIGASFAGVRAMTATSGGGFSLMTEGYGLAGITETPLVIIEGQRPGPATGLPTWGGQGDLRFVLHAAQDDFPRIVLAPGDPEECFWLTIEAFNLAEKYQTPVVILIDKHLAESRQWSEYPETSGVKIDRGALMSEEGQQKEYKRYEITESGISPRAIPGRKGFTFRANSDEHSEEGFSEESAENRIAQVEKRMRKMENCQKEVPDPKVYGSDKAKILIVGWGSSKGPILEAQNILSKEKIATRFLHLNFLNPLPKEFLAKFFKNVKEDKVLMVEQNSTAQCAGLIREKIGFDIKNHLLKYDGRPLFPEEIVNKVKEII
mgnify:CR=1 FL=1